MKDLLLPENRFLTYEESGNGFPILFVHAPCIGSINFTEQAPLSNEFHLLVPDLRGHGGSFSAATPFSMGDLADDLYLFLQEKNIKKVALCGYSQGASIVLEFMLRYPDMVACAILVSGFSEVNDIRLNTRFLLGERIAAMGGVNLIARGTGAAHHLDPDKRKTWISHSEQSDPDTVTQLYKIGRTYRCTDQLKNIQHPVLLLYGEKDIHMHHYGHLMAKELPNSSLRLLPGLSHYIVTLGAKDFNDLCKAFVQRHALTPLMV